MDARDLRIGNYIGIIHSGIETKATIQHINFIADGDTTYKPIELTEEWLKKFGFKKIEDFRGSFHFELGGFWVYLIKDVFEIELETLYERHNLCKEWRYVHQLQNLYFALTGEELNRLDT